MPARRASLVVGGADDEPVVLSGPPRALTGRIALHNASDAKVVLRDAGLTDPSGVLRLPVARHRVAPLVLRPDQTGSLPLSIAVDPTTPPGEYSAELDVGGRSPAVVIHVAEDFNPTVRPRSLVIANRPGVEQAKQIIVSNDGNVPFTVGDPGSVELWDDARADRIRRLVVEPLSGHETVDLEAVVVAVLAAAREDQPRAGEAEVRLRDGPVELRPGETRALDATVTLAAELPDTGRFRGRMAVLTRDVDLIVVATGGPIVDEPPAPKRARRAPAGGGRSRKTGEKS